MFKDWENLQDWKPPKEEDTLEATWWLFDREPGMDDILEQAGEEPLKEMIEKLKVYPFQDTEGKDRMFVARYEFPKAGEEFQFPQAVFMENPCGFIDFLTGFPLECVEMLILIGEHSSKPDKVAVLAGEGYAAPPVPDDFFAGYDEDKILLNYLFLNAANVDWMAKNLEGEPDPTNLHWWLRLNLLEKFPAIDGGEVETKFPVPGEFVALGLRLMPDKPWGEQKSSPFLYAGNWMDTVYYTSAVITEVIDPTDDVPCSTYKVRWRVCDKSDDKGVIEGVRPSDFCEYRVGDRVTLLKDVSTEKVSQLWKDEDMKTFGDNWQIVPITFYGLDQEDQEE